MSEFPCLSYRGQGHNGHTRMTLYGNDVLRETNYGTHSARDKRTNPINV